MEAPLGLELDESVLLFIPVETSQTPYVTSIYLYDATASSSARTKEQITAKYALEKQVIGEILTKLAIQNIRQPFPPNPFIVHGNGYELHCGASSALYARGASRGLMRLRAHAALKPWPYGEKLGLGWGRMELQASKEKWQVAFVMKD